MMINNTLKKVALFFTLLTFTLSQAVAQSENIVPSIYKNADKQKMNHWVDSVYATLNTDQRIGQLFSIIIAGNNNAANKKRIRTLVTEQHIGGLLFSKITIQDHADLTNYAQSLAKTPLMVALDGEWGLGMRIQNTTPWPRNMMLGAIQNDSLLYYYGLEVARQCKEMGIHVNFAPALDVNTNPNNPVIGIRSFGENPERVARCGVMYSKGLEAGGVMSVAKHFPGHGDTSTDSHHSLPTIYHDLERLQNFEFVPFTKYIQAKLSGMMIGHLNIPALDKSGQPSSLSKPIVTNLLQDEMGFSGLIFTDGLQMKGVANEEKHSVRALLAGIDVLLSPTYPSKEFNSVKAAVANGEISKDLIETKAKKVLAYKYILGARSKEAVKVDKRRLDKRLNTAYADWLNRKLNENSITLLKEENNIIPINKLNTRKIAAISIGASKRNDFLEMTKLYADVTTFSVNDGAGLLALKSELAQYNTVIFSIHNRNATNNSAIAEIAKDKESILAFFINPYHLRSYASAINASKAVVLSYEDTELSHTYTAQAIFGGTEIQGLLPVSIGNFLKEGTGLVKKKLVWPMASLRKQD